MLKLRFVRLFLALFFGFALAGCDVDVTGETELPKVDVDVETEPGSLPEVDVRGPDVDLETKKVEVPVPDIDVDLPGEHEEHIDASAEDVD